MKLISGSWNRNQLGAVLLLILGMTFLLGWEAPPWSGQVRVHRSLFHRAKVPFVSGMCVKDAIQQSRGTLGVLDQESVVLYRWRHWLPERIPEGAVVGMQCALQTVGLPGWSDSLWFWWDRVVPRQSCWYEVARDEAAMDVLLHAGELIVLSRKQEYSPP